MDKLSRNDELCQSDIFYIDLVFKAVVYSLLGRYFSDVLFGI